MTDVVDAVTRSRMMSGIKARDTKPELLVRHYLHQQGFRYRLHNRQLPGCPDLVLARWGAVVQIHGCFWHAHEGCHLFTFPSTRPTFWRKKLLKNRERDQANERKLVEAGWRVATVWECALKDGSSSHLRELESWLRDSQPPTLELRSSSAT